MFLLVKSLCTTRRARASSLVTHGGSASLYMLQPLLFICCNSLLQLFTCCNRFECPHMLQPLRVSIHAATASSLHTCCNRFESPYMLQPLLVSIHAATASSLHTCCNRFESPYRLSLSEPLYCKRGRFEHGWFAKRPLLLVCKASSFAGLQSVLFCWFAIAG